MNNVVGSMLGAAFLVVPGFFYAEIAYAESSKTDLSMSGTIYSGARRVDTGELGRQYSNAYIGAFGDNTSSISTSASTVVKNWKIDGTITLNAKGGMGMDVNDQNNLNSSSVNVSSSLSLGIEDNEGKLGSLWISGSAKSNSSNSANKASTTYYKGDLGFVDSVTYGTNDEVSVGGVFGYYSLSSTGAHLEYYTAEYIKGLTFAVNYSPMSDRLVGSNKFDSMGFGGQYQSTLNDVDVDLRVGYTSRVNEKSGFKTSTVGDYHIRGLASSAAFLYKGLDGSIAYVKLDPRGSGNTNVDNSAADALTNKYGQKPAILNAFELGYKFDVMGRDLAINGEYSISRHWRNDDSKAVIKGARLAYDMNDNVSLHVVLQEHSANGIKVSGADADTTDFRAPKKIKVVAVGFKYSIDSIKF